MITKKLSFYCDCFNDLLLHRLRQRVHLLTYSLHVIKHQRLSEEERKCYAQALQNAEKISEMLDWLTSDLNHLIECIHGDRDSPWADD